MACRWQKCQKISPFIHFSVYDFTCIVVSRGSWWLTGHQLHTPLDHVHAFLLVESPRCSNCNKLGHVAGRCYWKDRKDTKVNQLSVENESREENSDITCYNCQGKGHIAKHCRKPKKRFEIQGLIKERNGNNNHSGNEFRPSESSSRPTVQYTH